MQSYKKLYTYWYGVIIYDWTVIFCEKWIKSFKQKEQMIGAGRSGKQNNVEGADGMVTSLKTAIKLSGVAKHSLEELLNDFEDFLRQHGLRQWGKDEEISVELRSRIARFINDLANAESEEEAIKKLQAVPFPQNPEMAANILITLCHQATYLLHKQILSLKKKHEREGGLTEELYRKRIDFRRRH